MNTFLKCRLCLEETNKYVNIFIEDFAYMIELLTGLEVRHSDGLPKISCLDCYREVKSAMLTRYQIIHCYKVLLGQINKSAISNANKNKTISTRSSSIHETHKLSNKCTGDENIYSFSDCDKSEDKSTNEVIKEVVMLQDTQEISKIAKHNEKVLKSKIRFKRKKRIYPVPSKQDNLLKILKPEHVDFLKTINRKERVACPVCFKEIFGMNMKNHFITHNYDPVICDTCGKRSKNAQALQDHINYYHKTTPDRFVCDKCGRGFRVKCALDKHEKKEHGSAERAYKCTICGKGFFEKTHLKSHIDITHNKVKPFKCEHCGKDFGRRTQFVTHQLVHSKENKHHCQVCGKGFKIKQTMQTHLKGVHGIDNVTIFF